MPKEPKEPKAPKATEPELAAFAVRSKKEASASRKSKNEGASPRGRSTLMVPYVGSIEGVEEVELSGPDASIDQHVQDTERLVQALTAAVGAHEPLMAKAVALTEERCTAEKRAAVEAATRAAIQTTELRCAHERRIAVEQAVMEAAQAAKVAQEAAVAEAIRLTEERLAAEAARAAQDATITTARTLGITEDDVLTNMTASNFEQATASAGAALAAVSSLLQNERVSSPPTDLAAATPTAVTPSPPPPAPAVAAKDESLHFF